MRVTLESNVKDFATGLSIQETTITTGSVLRATISALFTPRAFGSSSPKNSVVTVRHAVAYASPAEPKI